MIKFRAWDKVAKVMIYHIEQTYDGLGDFQENENIEDYVSDISLGCFADWLENDQFVIMQSTGLFDVNGKEIFGNDIVEWKHNGAGRLIRGIVKRDVDFDFLGVQVCRFDDLTPFGHLTNQRATVLGNVYQNPELVEVQE